MDMVDGHWLHLPEPGSMLQQSTWIMECIEQARRAWMIWGYKPRNEMKWTESDAAFMAWVDNGD